MYVKKEREISRLYNERNDLVLILGL
jgi:hypothetical protein